MKKLIILLLLPFCCINFLSAHCQIPCGIYDDALRILIIEEDISTISKSIIKINELDKMEKNAQNQQQLIRWVNNKETHAQNIQNVVSEYFLAQRLKPKSKNDDGYEKYVKLTTSCQKIIFYAMKCKQNVDKKYVESLSSALNQLVDIYFDEHGKSHLINLRHKN